MGLVDRRWINPVPAPSRASVQANQISLVMLEESRCIARQVVRGESLMTDLNSLYIVTISIHGLIRGQNLELGRDADTGGQTKYVVELARSLAHRPEVGRVDLITRR
ncbi:MAG: hypothetical protein EA000_25100, partial [Oscillatoriales cyanobacterium]